MAYHPVVRRRHFASPARAGAARALAALMIAPALGCQADLPRLRADGGGLDAPCTPFVDLVVEHKPAGGDNDPDAAQAVLGEPDAAALEVAADTVLTLAFLGLGAVTDEPGADVGVVVVAAPEAGTLVTGYTSADGVEFDFAGDLTAEATTLDVGLMAGRPSASYVRLVGISGALSVDAVQAIHDRCP